MMEYLVGYIIQLLPSFLAVMCVLTLHEFAHAYVAYKCGDPTPKFYRRLTLNPFRHFDLVGLLAFTLVGFGWAKPVPINPYNFKKYRKGLLLTASAGVVINYITAFLFYPLFLLSLLLFQKVGYVPLAEELLTGFTYYLFAYSLSFAVFNLLPLYPLDGFRILDALNKRRGRIYRFLRDNGRWILLGLIFESFLCRMLESVLPIVGYLNILGWIMQFAVGILGWPITTLWGLIPW